MISSSYEGKESQKLETVTELKGTIPQGYNLYNNNSTFISLIHTFPWRET